MEVKVANQQQQKFKNRVRQWRNIPWREFSPWIISVSNTLAYEYGRLVVSVLWRGSLTHSWNGLVRRANWTYLCETLEWKDALAAGMEGQGGSTGDTHWAKVAEDQPSPCKVVCLDCDKTIFVNVSKACFSRLTCTRARGRVKSSVPLDDHYQVTLQSVTPVAKKRARGSISLSRRSLHEHLPIFSVYKTFRCRKKTLWS